MKRRYLAYGCIAASVLILCLALLAAPIWILDNELGGRWTREAAWDAGHIGLGIYMPSLIRHLDDRRPLVRQYAHESIERITGQKFNYKPDDAPTEENIQEIRDWWEQNKFLLWRWTSGK